MNGKTTKPIRIPFVAELKDALKNIGALENEISDIDKAADESREALEKLGAEGEKAGRDAEKSFSLLGITSSTKLKKQLDSARESAQKITDTFGAGSIESVRAWEAVERKVARVNKFIETDTKKTYSDIARTAGKKLGDIAANWSKRAAMGLAAGAAAGGAALTATASQALEVDRSANVAGLDIKKMQELGFAAKSVGIETEDLADKLKDINDKFGDFFQTGAGPLKDFFKDIAPKVKMTALEFRRLDSADRLQAFVTALEKSKIKLENGGTFYLEGLASDSTKLLGLFKNNGAEIQRLAEIGRETGGFFTKQDVDNAKELQLQTLRLKTSMQSIGSELMNSGIVETLQKIVDVTISGINTLKEYLGPEVFKIGIMVAAIGTALLVVASAIGYLIMGLAALGPILAMIKAVFVAVGGLFSLFAGAGAIMSTVMTVLSAIGAAIAAIGAIPLAIIAGIIAALAAIYIFWDEIVWFVTELLPEFIGKVADLIVAGFKISVDFIKDLFWGLFDMIVSGFSKIKDFAAGILSVINPMSWFAEAPVALFTAAAPNVNYSLPEVVSSENTQPIEKFAVDFNIAGQTYPVETDAETAARIRRDSNKKQATKSTLKPRFAK